MFIELYLKESNEKRMINLLHVKLVSPLEDGARLSFNKTSVDCYNSYSDIKESIRNMDSFFVDPSPIQLELKLK